MEGRREEEGLFGEFHSLGWCWSRRPTGHETTLLDQQEWVDKLVTKSGKGFRFRDRSSLSAFSLSLFLAFRLLYLNLIKRRASEFPGQSGMSGGCTDMDMNINRGSDQYCPAGTPHFASRIQGAHSSSF